MPTIQKEITDAFLKQLGESKEVSAEKIEKLRATLSSGKKPRAEELAKIFAEPDHGDIK